MEEEVGRQLDWHAVAVPSQPLEVELGDLLDALEAPAPSPAGGTAAAVAAAMAASLVVMVGRGSPAWPDGAAVALDAGAARERLLELGAEDVEAFAAVLAAFRTSADPRDSLIHAAEVPLEIAKLAAQVAELAARAGRDGKRPLSADAEVAAVLASAACRAAMLVVRANLAAIPSDDRAAALLRAVREVEGRASTI